jgi:heptosyltransferase-3
MRRISKTTAARRVGVYFGRRGRRLLGSILDLIIRVPENLPLAAVHDVRRVLLVRPNFRIGNTLIVSPLVLALHQRFPGAQIDFLSGDTTATLLANLPVATVHSISRRFITRPWQFVAFIRRLRRVRYDVAVETGSSFSGGLFAFLSGARYRIGGTGKSDRFFNVRLPQTFREHMYDKPVAFARLLGADCPDHPVYVVSAAEAAQAEAFLATAGFVADGQVQSFVALFVGGHQKKRWPLSEWLELAHALGRAGSRVAVFLGPEELQFAERFRRRLAGLAVVISPQPLRTFAALWSKATLIVTPDSGPMHLAAALGVPTIAILQSERSLKYCPRKPEDVLMMRPKAAEVLATVLRHPRWAALRDAARNCSAPPPAQSLDRNSTTPSNA